MTYLVEETEKKEKLIREGKLPDIPGLWPAYMITGGHHILYGIAQPLEEKLYRCTECMADWQGAPKDGPCPVCQTKNNIYQLNIVELHMWQCRECKFEWISEVGLECPECGCFRT